MPPVARYSAHAALAPGAVIALLYGGRMYRYVVLDLGPDLRLRASYDSLPAAVEAYIERPTNSSTALVRVDGQTGEPTVLLAWPADPSALDHNAAFRERARRAVESGPP